MFIKILIILYFFCMPFLSAHSNKKKILKSHEHGLGVLNIAQEDNILLIEFVIPGFDIVGFEYEAKVEEDLKKVQNALNILSDYNNMIKISGSGECRNTDSSSSVISEGKHSEFISKYMFKCNKISNLKVIYIKYFGKFDNSKKLNIKIIGNNKKSTYVINKSKKILTVKGHF